MSVSGSIVVGLTGKYCAGKSTIGDWLEQQGACHIEADRLGHQAVIDCQTAIVARFGEGILVDGLIDRKLLGQRVFGKTGDLAALEDIIHPAVIARIQAIIAERRLLVAASSRMGESPLNGILPSLIVLDAALLFKSDLDSLCDLVIWVNAPWIMRLWRGLRRDKRGLGPTLALMASQKALGPKHREPNADIIKVYNFCRHCARGRVRQILERYNG